MITPIPYLNFPGTCAEAFAAYEKLFGGKIIAMMKAEDPAMGGPDFVGMIMHARMMLSGALLMGSDAPPSRYQKPQGFSVNLNVDDPAEADRIFAGLAEGGSVDMAIGKLLGAPLRHVQGQVWNPLDGQL